MHKREEDDQDLLVDKKMDEINVNMKVYFQRIGDSKNNKPNTIN